MKTIGLVLTPKEAMILQVELTESAYRLGAKAHQCRKEGKEILADIYNDNETEIIAVLDQLSTAMLAAEE